MNSESPFEDLSRVTWNMHQHPLCDLSLPVAQNGTEAASTVFWVPHGLIQSGYAPQSGCIAQTALGDTEPWVLNE